MPAKKPTEMVQLKLRLPDALRRRIVHEAELSGRSLNSEMVWQLTRVYLAEQGDAPAKVVELSKRIEQLETELAAERLIKSPQWPAMMAKLEKGRKEPKAE